MKKGKLSTKILLSMIVGVIIGFLFNKEIAILPQFIYQPLEKYILSPGGTIFINAIKMLVVPMVLVSLINGVSQMGDIKKLGRIGRKTIIFYLCTTAIAITIGIGLAQVINPGINNINAANNVEVKIQKAKDVTSVIVDMVPTNPFKAMVDGKMLQVIVFSLLVGAAITVIKKEKAKIVIDFFDALNDIVLNIIDFVMKLAPIGVFCLITKVIATLGLSSLRNLGLYMITIVIALLIHLIFVYTGALVLFARLNPIVFFKKFWSVMTLAFSTSSSNATLPVTMETVEKKFGVKKSIFGFTLPLGATINMDGTAIMQGVATVFIAQLFNVNLSITQLLTVILTATLASVGTAGVPGVGMITLAMVLESVGLPTEGIALIIGVDRILDMCRTAVNVTGDTVVTLIVAKGENEINEEVFYSDEGILKNKELGKLTEECN